MSQKITSKKLDTLRALQANAIAYQREGISMGQVIADIERKIEAEKRELSTTPEIKALKLRREVPQGPYEIIQYYSTVIIETKLGRIELSTDFDGSGIGCEPLRATGEFLLGCLRSLEERPRHV